MLKRTRMNLKGLSAGILNVLLIFGALAGTECTINTASNENNNESGSSGTGGTGGGVAYRIGGTGPAGGFIFYGKGTNTGGSVAYRIGGTGPTGGFIFCRMCVGYRFNFSNSLMSA